MTNASKGHDMNRGTIMVLKRLLITALGALGLGALAAGQAFAQGNGLEGDGGIPAPKLYGDIVSCAGGALPDASISKIPTMNLFGAMGLVETALEQARTGPDADIDADDMRPAFEELLKFGANCDNPIGNNYQKAVNIYREYLRAKDALPAADATPDADATAAFNSAMEDKDDFGGAVYNEVYNHLDKQTSAEKAITAYNKLVGSDGTLALLKQNGADDNGGYDAIAINGESFNPDNLSNTDDDPALTNLLNRVYGEKAITGFRSIAGNDTADDDELSETELMAAFNSAGVLQLIEDADEAPTASDNITTLGQITTELSKWEMVVKDAQETVDEAAEAGNLDTQNIREDLRRKTAARDHVQDELDRLTRIVRAQNRGITGTQVTIGEGDSATTFENERDLLNEYSRVQNQVDAAADGVRTAVKALDNANRALQDQASDAGSYLDQLVTLREYQKAAADAALLAGGGEDAAQSLKDEVTAATENLAAAMSQRVNHMALSGDTPAGKLLAALLESDEDEADDGLALVNAIAEVSEDSGAVSMNTEKNTEQDTRLDDHDTKLLAKKEYIENIAAEVGIDPMTGEGTGEGGMSRIDHNEYRSMANAMEIGMDEDGMSRIDHNETRSLANAGAIEMNSGRIGANATAITGNTGMIADNASAIGRNSGLISDNRAMIGELSESLEVVRAGVAASMALAGMPAINGRGISIGVGSFDGESAFAVGFQIQGEMASFKVGLTSGGGATGASAGVGFQF